VVPYPQPGVTASMAAVAPMIVLKKSTTVLLQHFLSTCSAVSPEDETAKVLSWLPSAVPVYAVNVGCVRVSHPSQEVQMRWKRMPFSQFHSLKPSLSSLNPLTRHLGMTDASNKFLLPPPPHDVGCVWF
jgi:hypothetical protein